MLRQSRIKFWRIWTLTGEHIWPSHPASAIQCSQLAASMSFVRFACCLHAVTSWGESWAFRTCSRSSADLYRRNQRRQRLARWLRIARVTYQTMPGVKLANLDLRWNRDTRRTRVIDWQLRSVRFYTTPKIATSELIGLTRWLVDAAVKLDCMPGFRNHVEFDGL